MGGFAMAVHCGTGGVSFPSVSAVLFFEALIQLGTLALLIPSFFPMLRPLAPDRCSCIASLRVSCGYAHGFLSGVYLQLQFLHRHLWLPALVNPAFFWLRPSPHLGHVRPWAVVFLPIS
jgi:hypothetical protein